MSHALFEGLESRTLMAADATIRRPISDFIDNQGTLGLPRQVPLVENFVGLSDTKNDLGVSFDYAGLADDALGGRLGTTFDGSITERALRGGGSEVNMVLHTHNALTWVIPFDPTIPFDPNDPAGPGNQFGNNDLLFGARADDVVRGATPALGDGTLTLTYLAPKAGAPIPDLYQLIFFPAAGQQVLQIKVIGGATGTLADGSPGRIQFTEVGLFNTGFHGAVGDGFPAERISIIPTGGGVLGTRQSILA